MMMHGQNKHIKYNKKVKKNWRNRKNMDKNMEKNNKRTKKTIVKRTKWKEMKINPKKKICWIVLRKSRK